ncbi:MAG: hypothetical protein FJ029_00460 [Actinobacteria bacterium]|nr:hypothetical protein [Actinomycetota bacterium]
MAIDEPLRAYADAQTSIRIAAMRHPAKDLPAFPVGINVFLTGHLVAVASA